MAKNKIATFVYVLAVTSAQCANLAHISGSLGIIDEIMHYGKHNVTVAVQDSLSSDLKSDDLIFPETRHIDRSDFVHWDFYDELLNGGKPSCEENRIDMQDFVNLVPVKEVQGIVARYYRNDIEVQKAYAYLRSSEFENVKNSIIELPQVTKFLNFFNDSGLDVIEFVYAITNLTARPEDYPIEVGENENSTEPIESLNGLHGLVDSILDVLPQDQILSLFFDKLEENEKFSKLVHEFASPEFEIILIKLEDSVDLRNLMYTLHNNGIYITKIVDSLKAFFFLGTF